MNLRRMCPLPAVFALLSLSVLVGCGSGGGSNGSTSYATPAISSLSPAAIMVGSTGLTLTVAGSNFIAASEVNWNGRPISTQYVSANSLQAALTAAQLANAAYVAITVTNPAADGGGGSNSATLAISTSPDSNPVPSFSSLSPVSADVGSAALAIWVTGTNFLNTSTVEWNGTPLSTSYNSSTSLVAQVPASDMTTAGNNTITVVNPAPSGGTSGSLNFTVIAVGMGTQVSVFQPANNLAWDPVNQVIYLSQSTAAGNNSNSIQILNPLTGALGASASVANEPDLLAVSSSSKYLYVSLPGTSSVQRLTLPNLGTDIVIPLGSDPFYGPFYALDLQASPVADDTVAVVRGASNTTTPELGGVLIYDNGVARSNGLCVVASTACDLVSFDSIQWNNTATEMYAADNETTDFEFYTIPVSSAGFGAVTTYAGVVQGFEDHIHYDATTGYVYDDDGVAIDPASGTIVGTFAASGMMVPDGANGRVYFLVQSVDSNSGLSTYTVQTFDINTFNPISTVSIQNMQGTPTHLIRWGNGGVAFTTTLTVSGGAKTGAVFVISGSLLSGSAEHSGPPAS